MVLHHQFLVWFGKEIDSHISEKLPDCQKKKNFQTHLRNCLQSSSLLACLKHFTKGIKTPSSINLWEPSRKFQNLPNDSRTSPKSSQIHSTEFPVPFWKFSCHLRQNLELFFNNLELFKFKTILGWLTGATVRGAFATKKRFHLDG